MGSSDLNAKQVLPFGRALPIVIECIPNIVVPMHTSGFHRTSWTLVQTASAGLADESRIALAALCQAYWRPVYAFIRRNGFDVEQSRDLTQSFFTLLLEKNYLLNADRTRGRFRSFLLTAVKHFLSNERDRANALKRGGGQERVSIDLVAAEAWQSSAVDTSTPEKLFERRWALSLLERVMERLRDEFTASEKIGDFDKLARFLNKESDSGGYDTAAEELGVSPGALRMSVHRLRRKYRHLMRKEIAETVSTPEEVEEEIRFLLSVLTG